MLFLLWLYLFVAASSAGPDAYCYITISDGAEYCYYYPTVGYQCEYGPSQDPTFRNMSACNYMGLCYVPLAGGKEVCYYSAPYGYDCYFELLPEYVANMTHCDNLKANSAPEIIFGLGLATRNALEDTEVLVSDITVIDIDARENERDGKGYMQVILTMTNGLVKFDPNASGVPPQDASDAFTVLQNAKDAGGVEWVAGNGSFATRLEMQIRMDPLVKLMKVLVVKAAQYFNSPAYGNQLLRLQVYVNDQGNTGGAAEVDSKAISFTVAAVNDPPVITAPDQTPVNEDTKMFLAGIAVNDVDAWEGTPSTVNVTMSVNKGTLLVTTRIPSRTWVNTSGSFFLSMENTVANLNAALATLQYQPYPDQNDDTGVDQLSIVADDMGHWGLSYGPADRIARTTIPLHVIPVNDPPVIFTPPYFYTDEDTPLVGFNMTLTDVDTFSGITVRLNVSNGVLEVPSLGVPKTRSLQWTDNLKNFSTLFSRIVYTPDPNFNGEDQLIIDATDNQPNNSFMPTRIVPIIVEAINDPPSIIYTCPTACNGSIYTTTAGQPSVAVGSRCIFNGVDDTHPRISVIDVDSGDKWIQILLAATHGTLKLNSTFGIQFTYPTNYNPLDPPDLILAMGTVGNLTTALKGLVYNRTTVGEDDIIIAANDMGNQGRGLPGTDVSILVVY